MHKKFTGLAAMICLPFLFIQSCSTRKATSTNESGNALLWKISGNGLQSPSFIMGTFHLMCKEDIIIPAAANEAIRNADEVYFELDLDDMSSSLKMMSFMKMKGGKTLQDIFTEEEYAKIEKYFKDSLSSSITSMNQMKPFLLISMMYPKLLGCKKQSGIDQELLKIAKEYKKPIGGLESVEFQASVFDSIPYEMQAKELLKSIDSIGVYKEQFRKMVESYKSQNMGEILELTRQENFGSSEFTEIMLDKRNINWVGQMKNMMPGKKLFFAVGAGHLPGENGVVNLLRREGYKVEPVK